MITKNSPTHEKLIALINVQTAMRSLYLVGEHGMSSKNTAKAYAELEVYEKQLNEMITNDKL